MRSQMLRNAIFGVLALAGAVGCGPDYALFKVHITIDPNLKQVDRDPITVCWITIKDGDKEVLHQEDLPAIVAPSPSDPTATILKAGCASNATQQNVGYLSYSTSRSGGTLTFTAEGWRHEGGDNFMVVSGTTSAEVRKYPPEVEVSVQMKK